METMGLQQPLGIFLWLKTLTQHFMAEIMDIFVKTIKFLSFNATTLYQKVVGVSGGVSGVCVTMFRVHGGLRAGTKTGAASSGHSGLYCQEPSLAISGNLATARGGNWQTRH